MNAKDLRRSVRWFRLRRWLHTPSILIRTAALKLALRTTDLNALTIEAIPAYRAGSPLEDRCHVCLRSRSGKAQVIVEVDVEHHTFEKLPAYRLRLEDLRFPFYPLPATWLDSNTRQADIGTGITPDDPCRTVQQYWGLNGRLLATHDDWLESQRKEQTP